MKVIVVGGGPAGMMAAIKAAEYGHNVSILEHNDRIGRKLLATGNGKCNLTNELLKDNPAKIYGSFYPEDKDGIRKKLVETIMTRFGYDDTISFFEEIGLITRNNGGLIYPYSEQASAVLDVLRFRLRDLGIKIYCGENVKEIIPQNKAFLIKTGNGEYYADRVIVTTGSSAQPKLGSDGSGYSILKKLGHTINEVRPGLVQLCCKGDFFKAVSGSRIRSKVSLYDKDNLIYSESGQIQFTDYGISGIVAMNVSNRLRLCRSNPRLSCDLTEDISESELEKILLKRIDNMTNRMSGELLIGILPKKIGDMLLKLSGIGYDKKYSDINKDQIRKLVDITKEFKVDITKTKTFEEAQIALGGIEITELTDRLESKYIPGVFVAGEILDVHGDCGGFNLQLAFSFGAVAGMLGELE